VRRGFFQRYLIGDAALTGRGLGTVAIAALARLVFTR
jgi:hypothetical protein